MKARRYQLKGNIIAFCLLLLVSVYRQLSLHFLPGDRARTFIVFACYLLLLGIWTVSLITQVTQKSLLHCLLAEAALMTAGLTIRFVQDTFLYTNIGLMRTSGLMVAATLPPMMVLGLYAAMGMGQPESYRIPKIWRLLWIPAIIMTCLLPVDDRVHFICRIIEGEEQPNLRFHPYIGCVFLIAMLLGLMILRVVVIFRRNHIMDNCPRMRLTFALAEPLIILVFIIPYLLSAMYHTPEVIEFYATLYYVEALSWEFYIAVGLVPANIAWKEAFSCSTLAMQILPTDGRPDISAANAVRVPESLMNTLKQGQTAELPDGTELHSYSIPGAEVIYRKDTRLLKQTLAELDSIAESLEQESGLLAKELQTGNHQNSLRERERIYNGLRQSAAAQLMRMNQLIKASASGADADRTLRILCILGTYVKRKCNLLLLREEHGAFTSEDLILSLSDLFSACRYAGIDAVFNDNRVSQSGGQTIFAAFETAEALLELHRFEIKAITARQEKTGGMLLQVVPKNACFFDAACTAAQAAAAAAGCTALCTETDGSYEVLLKEANGHG